jgi:hypothetical protein
MPQPSVRLFGVVSIATALGGCFQPQAAVMHGGADWVTINYSGDPSETQMPARQYCAQYERTPLLRQAADNTATYACLRPDTRP